MELLDARARVRRGSPRESACQTGSVIARRLLPALLTLVALAAVAAPSAGAAPVGGVQSISVGSATDPATAEQTLDRAKAVGAKLIRVNAIWASLEPRQGQQDANYLATVDRIVDGASARGIKTLLLVVGTPCWASSLGTKDCAAANANDSDATRYPPANPADFVKVSTFLAARYGAKLAAFEVWNEPDQSNELYWAGPDKVKRYVALAKAAYGPLKAANPQMKVLAGAFVGPNGKWLQALYDAGIKGSYDALSVHFYDLPLEALQVTRAVEKANKDKAPLWLAESGFSSCYVKGSKDAATDHVCLSRAGQAQALTDLFSATRSTSWLKAVIVYTLQDESTAYQFGLFDQSGKRKPAFTAVRNAFAKKKLKATKPTLRLTKAKGRVTIHATGSWVEVYSFAVKVNGKLRYRAAARTDRFGRIAFALPRSLGTRHVRVALTGRWTHKQATRST
jgi:Cellulase (glycosyl hydrolase family 5)